MKTTVLLTAIALASGVAMAQPQGPSSTSATRDRSATSANTSDFGVGRGRQVDGTMGRNSTASSYGTGTTMADNETNGRHAGSGDTLGNKTKHGAQRIGNAVKNAGHRVADAARGMTHRDRTQTASSRNDVRNDTRSMGAAGSDDGRRSRMDSAYSNWQRKSSRP